MSNKEGPKQGMVYLVGAGPGDPNLITIRGAQCLREADVILYDYLANEQLLKHARAEARIECLGRHGRTRIVPQAEIHQRMLDYARRGMRVVRLKGGDPAIFARVAEECGVLEAAGIPYEIVPGISAAAASGSFAGAPLTHREHASAVAFFTGQQQKAPAAELDFAALAAFPGTLVVFMGVSSVEYWTEGLLSNGKPPETPVAMVRRCSRPDQTKHVGRLDEIASHVRSTKTRPPAIFIIGEAATLARGASWFERRPLFGTTVLAARPEHQNERLAETLEGLGAQVLRQPAIRIEPPDNWNPVDDAIKDLSRFDWLVFSSANGVRFFLQRVMRRSDIRSLATSKLAAIGPATAKALGEFHLRADLVPDTYRAEALAEALAEQAQQGKSFLLLRASRGREVLSEMLSDAGGSVRQIVTYHSVDVNEADEELLDRIQSGGVDWVLATSSAIAHSLVRLLGRPPGRVASISPITSQSLRDAGWPVDAEAREYTMDGLVQAILAANNERR